MSKSRHDFLPSSHYNIGTPVKNQIRHWNIVCKTTNFNLQVHLPGGTTERTK